MTDSNVEDGDDSGVIGPALPPGFRAPGDDVNPKQDRSGDSETLIGPALPPQFVKDSDKKKTKKKVYGPSIDDGDASESSNSSSSSSLGSSSSSSKSDDDSEDEFGPVPASDESVAVKAAAEEADRKDDEERARREKEKWSAIRGDKKDDSKAEKKHDGHEEWMTSLPTERRGFDPLTERTFRKDGVAEIDKSWGSTPGHSEDHVQSHSKTDDKRHHHHHHEHKHDKHDSKHHHSHHHHHHHHKSKDDSGEKNKKETAKKEQPKSLLEEHLERLKKGEQPAKRQRVGTMTEMAWGIPGGGMPKPRTTSAYWDRERDMEAMHISRKTATELLGRAESLNSRFRSTGTSNHFI